MTSGRRLEALMDAMQDTPMTANQRYVVLCLARHADHKTGRNAWPGLRTLAQEARCKTETAQKALALAEELGIVAAEHRSHGRPTNWTILPKLSPETGQQVSPETGQECPPGVPPVSRSRGTTTETTTLLEGSPQEETSTSTHTPTTNGAGGSVRTDPLTDLPPEARTFAVDLAALALVKDPTHAELCDLADLAEYGHNNGYGWIKARAFFDHARDKRIRSMVNNAPTIYSEASRHSIPVASF